MKDAGVTFFIDSGADISIFPSHLADGLKTMALKTSFKVDDFGGSFQQLVDRCVSLEIKNYAWNYQRVILRVQHPLCAHRMRYTSETRTKIIS